MKDENPWFLQDEAPIADQDQDRDVYEDMGGRDDTDGFGADYDRYEKEMMEKMKQDKATEPERTR